MPTYEYACRNCSHRFETRQKMTDEPLTICPECGGHIRRVLFPAGIVFKGSGFYKTDHASGSVGGENGHAKSNGHVEPGKEAETKTSGESKSSESSQGKTGENQVATEAK
jgi:putative FmdB family regulatory protein